MLSVDLQSCTSSDSSGKFHILMCDPFTLPSLPLFDLRLKNIGTASCYYTHHYTPVGQSMLVTCTELGIDAL